MTFRSAAAVAALGALVAFSALGMIAGPRAAAASGTTSASGVTSTSIVLVDQPAWVGANTSVAVTVKVAHAPTGAHLVSKLYDRVPNLASLQRSVFGQFGTAVTPNGLTDERLDTSATGTDEPITATVSFQLSDTHSDPPSVIYIPPGKGGVYPLDLQVVDRSGRRLSELVTWIIRLPDATSSIQGNRPPLDVALVLPLHAGPSHAPDGSVAVTAAARARTAAIVRALTGAGSAPLTLAPTPELLDALGASSTTADGDLLAELRLQMTATGRSVVSGTYVDLDLPAWLRQPRLRDRATVEWSRGQQALQSALGTAPLQAMAIAPEDLTNDAVRWLGDHGVGDVVVPEEALEAGSQLPTRPFTLTSGTGASLHAMAINATATAGFRFADARQGLQEVLASLAQTAIDAPSGQQATVLAPPLGGAGWTADPAILDDLVAALTAPAPGPQVSPLVQLVPLPEVFSLPSATGAPNSTTPLALHPSDGDPPSLDAFDQHFATVQQQIASFRQMLGPSASPAGTTNTGLVRVTALDRLLGVAGAGQLTPAQRDDFLDGVSATLQQELGAIAAPKHQTVTLTSRSGSIPFTVHNSLGYPVQVELRLESSERLAFPAGTSQLVTLTGENTPVDIHVRTRTSGDVPLTITVTSPDGKLVLASTDYTVRSTAVSGVGLGLTIGAAVVLLAWWLRTWRRGRRAKRRRPAELLD